MASLPTLILRGALGNALRTYANRHANHDINHHANHHTNHHTNHHANMHASNRFHPPRLDLYEDVFKAAPSVLLLRPQVWRDTHHVHPNAPLVFDLTLLQHANRCAAAITAAISRDSFVLTAQGGKRVSHRVSDVVASETYTLAPPPETDERPKDVHLSFVTPLAVKVRQNPQKSTIDPAPSGSLIIRSHLSRLAALTKLGGWQDLLPLDSFAALENRWQRCRMMQYRDGKGRPFLGVTGEMTIYQVPAEVRSYLQLAEVTHIGKDTNYGFGHIRYRSLLD